jgi:hypothetical protein
MNNVKQIKISVGDPKWLAAVLHFQKVHMTNGLPFPDAIAAAAGDLLSRVIEHEGDLTGLGDDIAIETRDAEYFALGLVIGAFLERNGITIDQTASARETSN